MTDAERLEEMRTEHHERVRSAKDAKVFRDSGWAAALGLSGRAGLMGYCDACERDWPCDTAVALAEVERLRGVVREWGQLLIADGELTLDDVRAACYALPPGPS